VRDAPLAPFILTTAWDTKIPVLDEFTA